MRKLSVIIPTLQKNINILSKLVVLLDNDKSVDEIIIIDNTGKNFDKDFYSLSKKIKTIINNENEYVNPCWNKGVEISKNDYFALFNDDVLIQDNFCSEILELFNQNTGLIGIAKETVVNIEPSESKNIKFINQKPKIKKTSIRNEFYGIIMFGQKKDYYMIPADMKVWCGDDYLFYMNQKNNKKNYKITNCKIYHMHSLTSSLSIFDKIKEKDIKIMEHYFPDWYIDKHMEDMNIHSFLQQIFSIKNKNIHKVITICGIKFKFKSKKLVNNAKIQQLKQELNNSQIKYKQLQIDKQEEKTRGKIYHYPIDINSDDPRAYSINWIKENSKVLDVGCACGDFGEKLKELKNVEITGLEYNTESIEVAKLTNSYKNIIQCDLNKYKDIPLRNKKFDYIVCGDVLEHIYEPQKVIEYFKQYLTDDGYFIMSIPNIAHASIKANLLLNNFDYTPAGLLDQTHIRFFTYKTVIYFLSELNLEIEDCRLTHSCGINGFQLNNPYPDLPQEIREFILKDKHSSIIQYVVKCKKSERQDLTILNLNKIETELNNTPYMPGVEEYI